MVTSALWWCVDIFKTQSPVREKKVVTKVTKPNYFPQRARVGVGVGGQRAQEEIQMGFPFLSYWYTNILMQWELAGEIQGLLVMEKLWLA